MKGIDPQLMLTETFHSFQIGDEFTSNILADIATNTKVNVTHEEMLEKACKFIQGKKKSLLVESVEGEKWSVNINNRFVKRQVYKKVGDLSSWKTKSFPPIPQEYYDFVYIWNELDVGASYTAKEFHQKLIGEGIQVTYEGQVGKFLWVIADRNLCDVVPFQDTKKNIYTRIDAIPEWILKTKTTKYLKVRTGPYKSVLDTLPL